MDIIRCPYCRAVQPPLHDPKLVVTNCVQCGYEMSTNVRGLICDYVWLAIGGWLFAISAVATLAAVIVILPFVYPPGILYGLIGGVTQFIIAASLFALRNTAQNSWAIRQQLAQLQKNAVNK